MKRVDPFVTMLADERKARGLSTWEAEDLADLGSNVVRAWEIGQSSPMLPTLRKYTRAFGYRIALVRDDVDAEALARLEVERIPARPPADEFGLPPITPEMAAENRRILCEALGIKDTYVPFREAS